MARLYPVVLSGGSGARLWPLSRELHPKQLLNLTGDRSMIQKTALRVGDSGRFAPPLIICNAAHRFIIAEQFRAIGVAPSAIVLEPIGRNTAAACALAALMIAETDPDGIMLVLPADHLILDTGAFLAAVDQAATAAAAGRLVTFGITPNRPETGYGYIQKGPALDGIAGVHAVARFKEKPALAEAQVLAADGQHLWNSGMFVFPAGLFLQELGRHAPSIRSAAEGALAGRHVDLDFLRLDAEAFAASPSVSVDVAVMEKTDRAAVVPCALGWTDIGAWSALWEIGERDDAGNVVAGDVMLKDTRDSYVRGGGRLTAVVGLRDVVVVDTDDAVLVSSRDRVQDVKVIVERLKATGRREAIKPSEEHRPWGSVRVLRTDQRFVVNCMTVNPGGRMSLHRHHHRAEHWVVVAGTARVTGSKGEVFVYENQSIYNSVGDVHRLENPGKIPLVIIEIQTGSYLGDDDIVRLEDSGGQD